MADLSKIKIPNGTEYNLKDTQARADIESLNGSLATEQIPYEVINGQSPDANGAIVANTSRKCTSFISVARNSNILITATSASTLNWWYDSEKNPLSKFTINTGNEQPYKVPDNAAYVVLSQPKNNMVDFRLYSDVRYEITQVATQINGCIVEENSAWEE